jgi:drug/metabolite transporter (DMT)-like permease
MKASPVPYCRVGPASQLVASSTLPVSPSRLSPWRIGICTVAALVGFAGNSLITRSALDAQAIDAASFMCVRLIAGAVTLAFLAGVDTAIEQGSLASALALAGYALGFTFAYQHITTSAGAFLLFGGVQLTMIGWGLWRGERPPAIHWIGLAIATSGLWYLTWARGVTTPDPVGSMLMIGAGISWGLYSVRGCGATRPLAATAGNFVRTVPIALVVWALTAAQAQFTPYGLLLAIVSGAVTSGIAYTLWYAALPGLATLTAAMLQLAVPILTTVAAGWLLGEALSPRLLIAGTLILGGVLLAMLPRSTPGRV